MQARIEGDGARATLRVRGDLRGADATGLYRSLAELSSNPHVEHVRVELTEVETLDTLNAAALLEGVEALRRAGRQVDISGLREQHRSTFDLVRTAREEPQPPPRTPASARLGRRLWGRTNALAELVVDTWAAWLKVPLGRERFSVSATADQAVRLGVDALPIVALLSLLTGLILAFQSAYQLREFGAEPLVAEIVSLGMVREFGALMTAIILSGRSGAAITAELGTMAVREELDALRTMGINPVSFLVVPRVAALALVQPLLTMWSIGIGIAGGLLTTSAIGLPVPAIYARMDEALRIGDFALGVGKGLLFSGIIAFVGCFLGLRTRGGARSVGDGTTRSVVVSILLVVVVDSVVTTLWTSAGHGE